MTLSILSSGDKCFTRFVIYGFPPAVGINSRIIDIHILETKIKSIVTILGIEKNVISHVLAIIFLKCGVFKGFILGIVVVQLKTKI